MTKNFLRGDSMELATIFLIWLAVTVIDNLAKRKTKRLPPPNQSPDFDIPTLANDPNRPGEEVPIFINQPNQAEVRPKKIKSTPRTTIEPTREPETSELNLNLTPTTMLESFVLTEIWDKPKALRRKNFSRR